MRQDPMASAVRAIGPSLLIALLMDAPQLKTRWPSHYATVFADDPGTSVLTFTSLGMVSLSHAMRASSGRDSSRTVALWKDSQTGLVEIDLPAEATGIILCLTNKKRHKKALMADGIIEMIICWCSAGYIQLVVRNCPKTRLMLMWAIILRYTDRCDAVVDTSRGAGQLGQSEVVDVLLIVSNQDSPALR